MYQDITYLSPLYGEFYGYIYNWEAAANGTADCSDTDYGGLAPEGWHVPTDFELSTLVTYLDSSDASSMLADRKDLWNPADTTLIDSSDFGATGFNALPAGYRDFSTGTYWSMGSFGSFWSSTEKDDDEAWCRLLNYSYSYVNRTESDKRFGFSIRCIKDV